VRFDGVFFTPAPALTAPPPPRRAGELLKCLVLTGFRDLEVVDLDTIDVSNLNRQFLFRPAHVGRPKSTCAAEVVAAMAPGVRILAHHGNIKTPAFGVRFIAGFDLVFNALDNVDARRHVNRLCLAASRPLLEAGTSGYAGQAHAIVKGATECLECQPAPPQRTYPICTIRSTPDKPVHAVVWAKELFKLLFGDAAGSYLYEGGSGGGGSGAASSEYMAAVAALPPVGAPAPAAAAYAAGVFQAVFHDDLAKRLEVAPEAFKGARARPVPLDLATALAGGYDGGAGGNSGGGGGGGVGGAQLRDQRTLSVAESARLFLDTLGTLVGDGGSRDTFGAREFSKDAPADLDFVTAATNLRAAMFAIPLQSRWEVKSIAGNIIAAIATTNAAVAGLQVLEALKLLRGAVVGGNGGAAAAAKRHGRFTWVVRAPAGGTRASLLLASPAAPPNPACAACGTPALLVRLDVRVTTLDALLAGLVKAPAGAGGLAFVSPQCDNGGGFLFCEENLDDEDAAEWAAAQARLLATPLAALPGGGVQDGTTLALSEFAPGAPREELSLTVLHRDGPGWVLEGVRGAMPPPPPPPPPAVKAPAAGKRRREEEDTDAVEILEEGEGEEGGADAKRAKVQQGSGAAAPDDEDVVLLVE
jgi:ubiquitin-like 1-activating enzyme E1 B